MPPRRVDPDVVISDRREAVLYLSAQALLLAAVVALLSTFVVTPAWRLLVIANVLGLPAVAIRTYLAKRMENRLGGRLPKEARWQGWWQTQLDHPTVFRQAVRLLTRRS